MADTDAAGHDTSSFGGLSAVVSAILSFAFVLITIKSWSREFGWLFALFALPLIGQVTGLFFLHHRPREKKTIILFLRFYLLTMVLCVGGCCFMWYMYLSHKD